MIIYENVTKKYNDVTVVDDLNLTINDGEFIVLIGPSGCGKTTTLKMMNRLIKLNQGQIMMDGKNINEMDAVKLRRGIGYVIQQIALFPNLTIGENITVVPKLLGWSREKREKRAKELLELVNMPYEANVNKYPNELSGGQQQRIGVLRALAADPPVILMDEPFGALDPITRDGLQDEFKALQKKLKKTIIFVTHDMDEAVKMADRIVFMRDGKILQAAAPEEMLRHPADPMISEFLGRHSYSSSGEDMICGDVMKKRVMTLGEDRKILESVAMMKQRELDSAVIIDHSDKYIGVATIENIRAKGKPGDRVGDLANRAVPTVRIHTSAKEAFDILVESNYPYIVVLHPNNTVAGIITRTSMTKAFASIVWGGDE